MTLPYFMIWLRAKLHGGVYRLNRLPADPTGRVYFNGQIWATWSKYPYWFATIWTRL